MSGGSSYEASTFCASFAERWLDENSNGREKFLAMRKADAEHPVEKVGRELRSMMTWLEPVEK